MTIENQIQDHLANLARETTTRIREICDVAQSVENRLDSYLYGLEKLQVLVKEAYGNLPEKTIQAIVGPKLWELLNRQSTDKKGLS